jgi:hypothetical protein
VQQTNAVNTIASAEAPLAVLVAAPADTAVDAPSSTGADATVVVEPSAEPRPRLWWVKSTFVLAAAAFCLLNGLLSFFTPFDFDPYRFNYKGWAWWTMADLRDNPYMHNVALLGSSTMVSALAGCDANYVGKPLDLTRYHKSAYLENKLVQSQGGEFSTFSLAAPGQMPSDAYLALKAMVARHHRPDVVIYGVAPRDFIDSMLSCPADTEQFKYLTRFVAIDEIAGKVFRDPLAKLDWLLQKLFYLYGYSLDFRLASTDATNTVLGTILPTPPSPTPFSWWDRQKLLPTYLPAEIQHAGIMAQPMKLAERKFVDNTAEYQQRYRYPDLHTFKTQFYFLSKLARFCHQERIELIIVNMPITFYNAHMLPDGVYANYEFKLREFAMYEKCSYFNLANFTRFNQEDFHDTVHLNAFGGSKFFDDVVQAINSDKRTRTIVQMSGLQMQTHTKLANEAASPTPAIGPAPTLNPATAIGPAPTPSPATAATDAHAQNPSLATPKPVKPLGTI